MGFMQNSYNPLGNPSFVSPVTRPYCQKVLPAAFDDSLSYYEVVCQIQEKINEIIGFFNTQDDKTEEIAKALAELSGEFEKFKAHGFDDYYSEQVGEWIDSNLEYVFSNVAKQVYFGITESGRFVAYIPDGWDDIIFDTGMNPAIDTYGRLILRWNVDGSPVNQTPEPRQ